MVSGTLLMDFYQKTGLPCAKWAPAPQINTKNLLKPWLLAALRATPLETPCQVPLVLGPMLPHYPPSAAANASHLTSHSGSARQTAALPALFWPGLSRTKQKYAEINIFPLKSGGSCHECLLVQPKVVGFEGLNNTEIYCRFSELEVAERPRKFWAKSRRQGATCNWGGNPIVRVRFPTPKKKIQYPLVN